MTVEDLEPCARVDAVVVEVRPGQSGHQVHLAFDRACPAALLAAVIVDRPP